MIFDVIFGLLESVLSLVFITWAAAGLHVYTRLHRLIKQPGGYFLVREEIDRLSKHPIKRWLL